MSAESASTSRPENPHGGRRGRRRDAMDTRGPGHLWWDLVFASLRAIGTVAKNFYATVGIFLSAGALVAITGTYAFARFASHVSSGRTQAFDESVLRWVAQHRSPSLEPIMMEITFLGTGTVVMAIVVVSGLFLWLSNHKYSAALLMICTLGGILLNTLLKVGYSRPRPQLFDWVMPALSWSFPSGHAMSAAAVYGTVAYLAARLQKRHLHRVITMLCAVVLIALIAITRLYLGVHYPSDLIAGVIIGLAWAAFCMATLEAIRIYARRRAPKVLAHEEAPARDTG
jgi:membrane-associated phospholipid phosphatase